MRLVFCSDPLRPREPDPAFQREVDAARSLGIAFDLIDHDALDTVMLAPLPVEERAVYRGWMMKPAQYAELHGRLREAGRVLVNTPEQYAHCHHLPRSFDVIAAHSPRTVWLPAEGMPAMDEVMTLLAPFGDGPVILKDYVKSQKHAWKEACFIPRACDRAQVERVVREFVRLQGADLNGGLVFREFVELERVGTHPKSGMPLSREFRQFFFDGKPIVGGRYWDEVPYGEQGQPPEWVSTIAARVRSRFFTMDVARTAAGEGLIVELGDGQVSGLPEAASPLELFRRLAAG
jgi:hypothetical protein